MSLQVWAGLNSNSNVVGNPINGAENEANDKELPSGVVEASPSSGVDMEEMDVEEPATLKEFPNKMAQFLSAINKVCLSSTEDLQNKFGLIDFPCQTSKFYSESCSSWLLSPFS